MNKKLIISGCANCPFLIVYNDGSGKGKDSITSGKCTHPSWNEVLGDPTIDKRQFARASDQKFYEVHPDTTPEWCPLPNDNSN